MTKLHILILQHPQEPDKELGSAKLAHSILENSKLRIGLSWPNLKAAWGDEVKPNKWAVLYLGSGIKDSGNDKPAVGLHFVDKKGRIIQREHPEIDGLVVLDGTWSQAKALWWRNPWLLKLRRLVLVPRHASNYRELRKEPRRECVSTIESISSALEFLGEDPAIIETLNNGFISFLENYRKGKATSL